MGRVAQQTQLTATGFNRTRQELIVCDEKGGIAIHAFREIVSARTRSVTYRCPMRQRMQSKKKSKYSSVAVDEHKQRLFAATSSSIHIFDAVSGSYLKSIRKENGIRQIQYLDKQLAVICHGEERFVGHLNTLTL